MSGTPGPLLPMGSHLLVKLHQGLGLLCLVEGKIPEQQVPCGGAEPWCEGFVPHSAPPPRAQNQGTGVWQGEGARGGVGVG